jgi:hypothetical protein
MLAIEITKGEQTSSSLRLRDLVRKTKSLSTSITDPIYTYNRMFNNLANK